MTYHHGNLRREIIDAALAAISETGSANWSLRELARRAGVSHTAPVHHFGDKTGVLTAIATEGYELLASTLKQASGGFAEMGVAYVRFALAHRAHFEVMFRPDLYRVDDPSLVSARSHARDLLTAGASSLSTDRAVALAAWSAAHGFASLWLNGAIPGSNDPAALARTVFQSMFTT